jgi:hypothetical protein
MARAKRPYLREPRPAPSDAEVEALLGVLRRFVANYHSVERWIPTDSLWAVYSQSWDFDHSGPRRDRFAICLDRLTVDGRLEQRDGHVRLVTEPAPAAKEESPSLHWLRRRRVTG